ncbi:MAG: hypothetical protein ACPGRZ_01410, partial [Alphaproteobacteria bacterium]
RILENAANVWRTESDGTTWVHVPSGLGFPDRIGPFKRLRRTILGESGQNIVVHHRIGERGWGAALTSVYVSVERGVPLAGEFAATANEIVRQYPDAKEIERDKIRLENLSGYIAVFDLPPTDKGKIRRTSLSAFEIGNVLIRIRSSYPAAEAAARAADVRTLTRDVLSRTIRP